MTSISQHKPRLAMNCVWFPKETNLIIQNITKYQWRPGNSIHHTWEIYICCTSVANFLWEMNRCRVWDERWPLPAEILQRGGYNLLTYETAKFSLPTGLHKEHSLYKIICSWKWNESVAVWDFTWEGSVKKLSGGRGGGGQMHELKSSAETFSWWELQTAFLKLDPSSLRIQAI